ncbi:UDP-galactopyranose mutase [Heyndrickxia coagulans P38]|uniref:UDP-galactopyranose mutase n=1 Tax=Heyndrickxia coagulans TaxID=1398 RepID=UPI000550A6EC|nr:UDP-galactopyranose mutase [Heyndrickxia coagulans]KGT37734.1 UDP-galactopyranose mutase [Heyndrickxia coagulans P38]MBF8417257.1 UDP-galactopyranose mutase [Heyndrickxia coagulans]
MKYDYLVVGTGLFGSVFSYEAAKRGKRVKVIDKRNHIAGNIYTEEIEGIQVHKYGAHIFHTNNREIWDYVNQFAEFNRYTNSPVANYKGEIYNLPFNMNTFNKLWGVVTPQEAKEKIEEQRKAAHIGKPTNLEEQAISLVGTDIYKKLVKGYTEKQWGRKATDLPAFIIKRLPVRFTYDNNYFNDKYQGIPIGGYTQIVEKMLSSELIDVELEADFFNKKEEYLESFPKIIYTGMIDQFFDYQFGTLEYRSLEFETSLLDEENYQGNAVVNYTDAETPYTRIIEHKHFEFGTQPKTVITKEYPKTWEKGDEPYYPMNDEKNNRIFKQYRELADKFPNIIFGGRLGMYKYYDMHQVIGAALTAVKQEFKN